MKSKYRFCPRPDVIQRVSLITSRCSANEPALGLERAAEIEHGYVWTGPKWQRKRKGAIIARAKGKNVDGEGEDKLTLAFLDDKKLARN